MKIKFTITFCLIGLYSIGQTREVLTTDTAVVMGKTTFGQDTAYFIKVTGNVDVFEVDPQKPKPFIPAYNGHWIVYYDSAKTKKATECTFESNKLVGYYMTWARNGQLLQKYTLRDSYNEYYEWDRNGNLLIEKKDF